MKYSYNNLLNLYVISIVNVTYKLCLFLIRYNTKITIRLITTAGTTAISDLLSLAITKENKLAPGNDLHNLSISFEGAVKVSLYGTSMPPCNKSTLYCLAPITSQEVTPQQVAEIIHGMWPTTTAPRDLQLLKKLCTSL